MPDQGPLRGRVAIVVASGAGTDPLAVARSLAAGGATVVVAGPPSEEVGRLLAVIEDAGGGRGAHFATSGEQDGEALVEFVAEQFRTTDPAA